jgi:hypothetical protein
MTTIQQQYIDMSKKLEQLEAQRDFDDPACVAMRARLDTLIDQLETRLRGAL